jgi:hypothetical protein
MAISITQGDLAYGLSEPRHQFLLSAAPDPYDFTIDIINILTTSFFTLSQGLFTPENLADPDLSQIEAIVRAPDFPDYKLVKKAFHFHFLCRAHLEKAIDDSIFFSYVGTSKFIRNRCKYGILWTLFQGKSIYFCIDSIDFKNIFAKSPCKKPFVTGHELRFIYRLCLSGDLSPDLRSRIKFIKKGALERTYEETRAPWESDPSILHGYVPKMEKKCWKIDFSLPPTYFESPTGKLLLTIADQVENELANEHFLRELENEIMGAQQEIIQGFELELPTK